MKLDYSSEYYSLLHDGSGTSAKAVVPVVLELVRPANVVDLGCGTGAWLAEFKRQGVQDVLGVDGPHVSIDQLEIKPTEFLVADLSRPLRLRIKFDLAMALEVAEHLQEEHAEEFVESLTQLADVVLFSAAIPHQGGEHHVNEQWPAYWSERFAFHDFVALDPFRGMLWERSDVDWWYAQNLVLYVRLDKIARYPWVSETAERGIPTLIHPSNYLQQAWRNRVMRVAVEIASATRPGETIVLADENRFGSLYLPERFVRPFIERNGVYFGPPTDADEAISQLIRMKNEGASYFAVGWPAFWWLDHYKKLTAFLDARCHSVLNNEHVIVYRMNG
jgi:SAM-dependent methyltransferase